MTLKSGDKMETDESLDLDALARVWERVHTPSQDAAAPGDPERARLARFIRNATAAGGMYALLAMKTRGSQAERTFRRLSREEADSERRLQTEFFLLTGDTWTPPAVHPSAPSLTEAVREAYLAETENARRLSESGPSSLFRELAERERAHAAALRQILERMI